MVFVGPRARETADKLARRCNTKCYDIDTIPRNIRGKFVVNYGGHYPEANINPMIFKNKITQNEMLSPLKRSPKIWKRLRDVPRDQFPILARRIFSSQGNNIALLKTPADRDNVPFKIQFYQKYIDKDREFRVHVLGTRTIVTEKIKVIPDDKDVVFGGAEGYAQPIYHGLSAGKLAEIAKEAVKTLNYDFGAVDIILGKEDHKFYILEVNSGPCLLKWMRIEYAAYFRDEERKWLERR